MKLSKNVVCFQKGFIQFNDAGVDNRSVAMTTQTELMRFGYMLDNDAFIMLGKADKADIVDFHNEVIDYLKEITGGTRTYAPFYPGFPTQVMEMSQYELWANQILHYMTNGSWKAEEWTKPFKTAFETVKYKTVTTGDQAKFLGIFTDLCSVGQSLMPQDLNVIKWFVSTNQTLVFPDSIPFKENLCTLAGMGLNVPVKTTTDVLRIAVHMSGGDISLPAVPKPMKKQRSIVRYRRTMESVPNLDREAFKFKKFKRSERKFILGLLDKSNCDIRDMKLKDARWVRLGEILHPGEYKTEFPRAYAAFHKIRNEKVVSWYGEVAKAFKNSFGEGLRKAAERPGEFLRRLDWWIRSTGKGNQSLILSVLFDLALKASNKVIFEVYTHFEGRKVPTKGRSVFIKGARKKTSLPDLPALKAEVVDAIQDTLFLALKERFKLLEPMGDCWVDPELKKIPLPTNMRSLSDTLVPTIRGQRTPFGTGKKVIRPFIHWFDENGTEDLDLHGFLLGDNMSINFGYNGTRNSSLGCYSGDVRHRRGACAEYVDINVDDAVAAGYNYFVMVVHNFENRPFSSMKDVVVGVQEREFAQSNANWLPDTIVNCFRPASGADMTLIGVYDLITREYIHLDLDWNTFSGYVARGDSNSLFTAIKPFITLPKLSVYDLVSCHVEARGRNVSKEVAEKHFLYEDFSTSYVETMKLMGV